MDRDRHRKRDHEKVSPQEFPNWLKLVTSQFRSLTDPQKCQVVEKLVHYCGPDQLELLTFLGKGLVYRDFILELPIELSTEILLYLDDDCLLNCCLVSKAWYSYIMSNCKIWCSMYRTRGGKVPSRNDYSADIYRQKFLNVRKRVTEIQNGESFTFTYLQGHQNRVTAVYYRNGKIATGSDDRTVKFWNVKTGQCIDTIQTHTVSYLRFDNKYLYTASCDDSAAVYDLKTKAQTHLFLGHTSAVFCLDYDQNLQLFITGSADKTVKIWSLGTGELLQTISGYHNNWVIKVQLLTKCLDDKIRLLTNDGKHCFLFVIDLNGNILELPDDSYNVDGHVVPLISSDLVTFATLRKDTEGPFKMTWLVSVENSSSMLGGKAGRDKRVWLPWQIFGNGALYGYGSKFCLLVVGAAGCEKCMDRFIILDMPCRRVIHSFDIPPFRQSKNMCSLSLGSCDWMEGLDDNNQSGLFLTACLKDNSILMMKWRQD